VSQQFEKVTGQQPVFRGDIIGRIVLGTGLEPRDRLDPPVDELNRLTATSQQLMNQYLQNIRTDIETWERTRYREACQTLLPILRWFERHLKQYPKLRRSQEFWSAHATAQSKLRELGDLAEGRNTSIGKVAKYLGSGTFGTVWLVKRDQGTEVAYKVYHATDLDKSEKLSRFDRGYRAMVQLDHPHIVRVHEQTWCPVGFVMDYIDGPNLRDFASERREPVEILIQLITIGETLKHAHSRGVVHRDVKPENIIMRWDQDKHQHRPFLTDFDLAWFSTATQFTKEGFGSLIYAAPEQLSKANSTLAHADTTDVYAFGQLLFFFVCRRDPVPMLSDNAYALREEIRGWGLEEPARRIVRLYEQCTQSHADKRIQDFREICDELFEISQLLKNVDHTRSLGFDAFARQISFSMVGMLPERLASDSSFYTTSGQTLVSISFRGDSERPSEVVFQLRAQVAPVLSTPSFEEGRRIINSRIDTVLKNYSQATRRAGTESPFETYLYIRGVPMSVDGVEQCRPILTRVIDCIERVV
jgi:eukaryotic-like serine/threonine-protein kinase